jgi:hypothetical protein
MPNTCNTCTTSTVSNSNDNNALYAAADDSGRLDLPEVNAHTPLGQAGSSWVVCFQRPPTVSHAMP